MLKTFLEWLELNESMSVYIKGYDYQNNIKDLDDLSWFLIRNVINPIEKERIKSGSEDEGWPVEYPISPDGSYYESGNLVLNFYTTGWSKESIDKIVKGIKYYLDQLVIKYAPPKQPEKSGKYKGKVIRIPILSMRKTKGAPPQLNMANDNAVLIIKDLLGLSLDGFSPRDLLIKIDNLDDDLIDIHKRDPYMTRGKSTVYWGGLSKDDIWKRIEILKQIAKWSIENGYEELYLA